MKNLPLNACEDDFSEIQQPQCKHSHQDHWHSDFGADRVGAGSTHQHGNGQFSCLHLGVCLLQNELFVSLIALSSIQSCLKLFLLAKQK